MNHQPPRVSLSLMRGGFLLEYGAFEREGSSTELSIELTFTNRLIES
jgi:hypothetical protein